MPEGPRPVPPDDTVRLVLSGTAINLPWAMVMWLKLTASARVAADLSAILTTISASYNTRFVPRVCNDVLLTQIAGTWIVPGGGEVVAVNSTTRTGTSAGSTAYNLATAVVLNWHVDKYYRGGKPRSYFPAPPIADTTDHAHFTGTAITNWTTAAAGFLADVNAASSGAISAVKLGTVSFQQANAWRSPPEFWQYNSVTVRSTLGVQRRRLLA